MARSKKHPKLAALNALVAKMEALGGTPAPAGKVALEKLADELKALFDFNDPEMDEADWELEDQVEEAWEVYSRLSDDFEKSGLQGADDAVAAAVAANRPDVVATLGSDEAFTAALARALNELARPYYSVKPAWLQAVVKLAGTAERRGAASAALTAALDAMISARLKDEGDELINHVAFGAVARTLGAMLPASRPAVATLLRALKFCRHDQCHFEALEQAGTVALALCGAKAAAAVPVIDALLERYADVYPGRRFIMELRYAKWLLKRDTAGARAYLAHPDHHRGLAFVAAALADLNDRRSLEVLRRRGKRLTNPVVAEAFAEARARLSKQSKPPTVADRMIFMFGAVSPSEEAHGASSDDVFVERAKKKGRVPAQVYEADEAGPSER